MGLPDGNRIAAAGCAALALLLAGCTSGHPAADAAADAAAPSGSGQPVSRVPGPAPESWLGYHADQARTGAVAGALPDPLRVAWHAGLGGAVRGQPLVADGRVIAATETNRVVALDPAGGRVLWSTTVGPPLTQVSATVGCGNIDPLGITSTAVIDPAAHAVWVVAEISDGGSSVQHRLVGLDLATGAIRAQADVDPPLPRGQTPLHLLQRTSLALANGRVYVSYGGHLGDCGNYHGWVVGAETADPGRQVAFQAAPGSEGGAIWQGGGAPAVDAAGNVYVSTGNANPFPTGPGPDPARYAESVVKLSPDLRVLASFKDPEASADEDLSTGNPVLLPGGTLFAVGKTDVGYLLRQSDLSLVARVRGVCGSDPDGGPAYDGATGRVFVPCRGGGIQVVEVGTATGRATDSATGSATGRPALGPKLSGADSAPIVAGGTVWAVDSRANTLAAFDAASGRRVQSLPIGADVPVFTSPTAALGMLFVATTDGVTAFH